MDFYFHIMKGVLLMNMGKKLRVGPWSVSKTSRDFLTMRNGSFIEEFLKVKEKWVNTFKQMMSYTNKK